MSVDVPNTNLYDVASRNAWLDNGTLVSTIPGVTLYGPYTGYQTNLNLFATNVTNPATGSFYQFQPFADLRFRLAFADAVNMTSININENNNLGQVAIKRNAARIPATGDLQHVHSSSVELQSDGGSGSAG